MKRVVVKIGTSLLANAGGALDEHRMRRFARELSGLLRAGIEVVVVSSGAIAAGMGELRLKKRPSNLPGKQATAAVGQVRLMERYRHCFALQKVTVAQILLTREDFENRSRAENARATLNSLLASRVIPIINENDTVATEEIKLGDNDTLAARVAVKIDADTLILLTDVDGLMTKPPRYGGGMLIPVVEKIGADIEALAHGQPGSDRGTGGMATKIRAAKIATHAGVRMIIASGRRPKVLLRLLQGLPEGTLFLAHKIN